MEMTTNQPFVRNTSWTERDVAQFIDSIDPVDFKDEAKEFNDIARLVQLAMDDAWLARAYFWGTATAMENQILYLGGNLRTNMERRLNQLENPSGVLAGDDLRTNKFSNESQPHVNEDVPVAERIADLKMRIDQITRKMAVASVHFCIAVENHDDLSKTLEQMTYSQIKARARERRAAFTAQAPVAVPQSA